MWVFGSLRWRPGLGKVHGTSGRCIKRGICSDNGMRDGRAATGRCVAWRRGAKCGGAEMWRCPLMRLSTDLVPAFTLPSANISVVPTSSTLRTFVARFRNSLFLREGCRHGRAGRARVGISILVEARPWLTFGGFQDRRRGSPRGDRRPDRAATVIARAWPPRLGPPSQAAAAKRWQAGMCSHLHRTLLSSCRPF